MKHVKDFNEHSIFNQYELVGPELDQLLDSINFIINSGEGIKIKPLDNTMIASGQCCLYVEILPNNELTIRRINDIFYENGFDCRLYQTD